MADALVRAELTQCAHRKRPLRHDGRIVVTLCSGEILGLLARFRLLAGYTWNDQSSEPSLGRTASTAKPLL